MGWPTIFFLCHCAYSVPLAILSEPDPPRQLVRSKGYARLPDLPPKGTPRSWCQTKDGITDVQAYVTSLDILKTQMQDLLGEKNLKMNFVANSGSATYFYGCPHYDLEQGAIFSNDIDTWCFGEGCVHGYKTLGPATKVPRGKATGIPLEIESFFPEGENFEAIPHLKWKAELKQIYQQAKANGPVTVTSGDQSVDILDCHSLCQFKSLMLEGDLVERGVVGKSVEKDGKISKHLVDLQDLHCLMRQCGFTREECLTPNQRKHKNGRLPEDKVLELYHKYVSMADLGKGPTKHATLAEIEAFKEKLQPNNLAWFNMIQNTGDPYRWITELDDSELGILRQVNAIHSLQQMLEEMQLQIQLKDTPDDPIVCSRLGVVPLAD